MGTFADKFELVPSIIDGWLSDFGGLKGKSVLDFGCGEGLQAAGIAKRFAPKVVCGVDINAEHEMLDRLLAEKQESTDRDKLNFITMSPGESLSPGPFDVVYSWSTFEHVDQAIFDNVIENIYNVMPEGGFLFIQIAPLYFSPEGSHLWEIGYRNWEHLTKQIDHIHADLHSSLSKEQAGALWSTFLTLNKITSTELVNRIEENGFRCVRRYETQTQRTPPASLSAIYQEEALVTDQIVVLFHKD